MKDLLTVSGLDVACISGKSKTPLVSGVSFTLQQGTCLGILGESGSGKSVTCRAIMGLMQGNFSISGMAEYGGKNLLSMSERDLRKLRGSEIAMIMQNPISAFDPLFSIGQQLVETFQAHRVISRNDSLELARSALASLLIREPELVLRSYPHQLSGGMLQRVMIALTLALHPRLIIADEPTTALDSVTQYEVLQELKRIRASEDCTMIFVSHDLGALKMLADDALVMYRGKVVEYGPASEVFNNPVHEHTRYLIETRRSLTGRFVELTTGVVCRDEIRESGHAAG